MVNHVPGLPSNGLVGRVAHLLAGLVAFPLGYMLVPYASPAYC